MTTTKSNLCEAVELLKNCTNPLLIAHKRPDGDTVGSTLALRLALLSLGKEPTVCCIHPIPANLSYLSGAETFLAEIDNIDQYDLTITIDLSDIARSGGIYKEEWRGKVPLLAIDHHETKELWGDANVVDSDAIATALPMMRILDELQVPIRNDIATCLLAAVLTDSQGLQTTTTTPATLKLVGELFERGGDYHTVTQKTIKEVAYQRMRGWGEALTRLQLEGDLAWTVIPLEEKKKLKIEDHDDLDLGNFISRTAEADLSVIFIEMNDGTVKVSFRTNDDYDVAPIAKSFGGGGHKTRSGCSITGSLDDVQKQVLPKVRELMQK